MSSPTFNRLLVLMEFAALAVAVAESRALGAVVDHPSYAASWIFPLVGIVVIGLRGGYARRMRRLLLDDLVQLTGGISVAAMLTLVLILTSEPGSRAGPQMATAWLLGCLNVVGVRVVMTTVRRVARQRMHLTERALVVGAGIVGAHIARRLRASPEYGLEPVGYLDGDPDPMLSPEALQLPILGTSADAPAVLGRTGARHLILAFSAQRDRDLLGVARAAQAMDVDVSVVPRLFDSLSARTRVEHVGGMPLLNLRRVDPTGWQFTVKHVFDRVVAGALLLLLSPLLLAIAAAVRLSSPGPVLFRQQRVGRDGSLFDVLKFRSMRLDARPAPPLRARGDAAPGGVEGDDRRTGIGTFLRKTSLDELPQLLNVARGEMSLVGPRPERPEFVTIFQQHLARYGERQRVRAGITGWAQVHGLRGQTSLADRVEWDNFYIENWSLWLDLKILVMTVATLFSWRHD
jgi:exopolysaccharide biosynthesis polyprenyl glycosylphosphotransferase